VWADRRRKRGWLEEELRAGSGEGGGRPGEWMEVEAELGREGSESFLSEKNSWKSAELENGRWRERREE